MNIKILNEVKCYYNRGAGRWMVTLCEDTNVPDGEKWWHEIKDFKTGIEAIDETIKILKHWKQSIIEAAIVIEQEGEV